LVCVHHLKRPILGHARDALSADGPGLVELHLRRGDPPPALDGVDAIVSMGGEQSVLEIDADPRLAAEGRWLAEAVLERGIPVLGVCLGAQLLAHALGGRVFRLPRRHVGWLPLELTAAGHDDPVLGAIPPAAHGLHWNEDGFEPPPGASELLERRAGAGCVAFRHGASAWGVQFHPEVDPPSLQHWYADWQPALAEAGVTEAAARERDAYHLGGQPALAGAIFSGFAGVAARRFAAQR